MGLSTGSESAFDEVMTIKHMRFRKRRLFNERGVSLPLALLPGKLTRRENTTTMVATTPSVALGR